MESALKGVIQPKGFPAPPKEWASDWETYPSFDGKFQLFAVTHKRGKGGPRAFVIAHGMGEHCGRYLHFLHYLGDSVDVIFCPDHRGCGRSEGLRGHTDDFRYYADDLALGIKKLDERLKKQYGRSEIHLFGHSMGSLVALDTVLRHPSLPLKTLTLSSPLIAAKVKVPFFKKASAGILAKVWGSLQLSNELNTADLSHDPEVVKNFNEDRLNTNKITPKAYVTLMSVMEQSGATDAGIKMPLFMVVPEDDAITDPEAAIAFFKKQKTQDKELKTYPGFFHEAYTELGKERAFEDLKSWIVRHSSSS
jgi:acylglycerol lipase